MLSRSPRNLAATRVAVDGVFSQGAGFAIDEQRAFTIPDALCDELRGARWSGAPNREVAAPVLVLMV